MIRRSAIDTAFLLADADAVKHVGHAQHGLDGHGLGDISAP